MNYKSENFKNCQFNPFEVFPFEAYPRLKEIIVKDDHRADSEEDDETDNHIVIPPDKMVRYIIALYDPKSPIIRGESNLLLRKEIAATIAGFDTDQEEMMEIIYDCKYDHIVMMIENFLRSFVKSMEWAMLVSYESAFWEFQSRLMQPLGRGSDKDKDLMSAVGNKTKLANDIQELYNKYQVAKDKFYGSDTILIDRASKIRRYSPEGVALFAKETAAHV